MCGAAGQPLVKADAVRRSAFRIGSIEMVLAMNQAIPVRVPAL
jgi:hypothetical protein